MNHLRVLNALLIAALSVVMSCVASYTLTGSAISAAVAASLEVAKYVSAYDAAACALRRKVYAALCCAALALAFAAVSAAGTAAYLSAAPAPTLQKNMHHLDSEAATKGLYDRLLGAGAFTRAERILREMNQAKKEKEKMENERAKKEVSWRRKVAFLIAALLEVVGLSAAVQAVFAHKRREKLHPQNESVKNETVARKAKKTATPRIEINPQGVSGVSFLADARIESDIASGEIRGMGYRSIKNKYGVTERAALEIAKRVRERSLLRDQRDVSLERGQ